VERLREAITSENGYDVLENTGFRGLPDRITLEDKQDVLRYNNVLTGICIYC